MGFTTEPRRHGEEELRKERVTAEAALAHGTDGKRGKGMLRGSDAQGVARDHLSARLSPSRKASEDESLGNNRERVREKGGKCFR